MSAAIHPDCEPLFDILGQNIPLGMVHSLIHKETLQLIETWEGIQQIYSACSRRDIEGLQTKISAWKPIDPSLIKVKELALRIFTHLSDPNTDRREAVLTDCLIVQIHLMRFLSNQVVPPEFLTVLIGSMM